ncbi:hypothetical protein ABPG72_015875 [Tetrahymena utriculariae]
MSTKLNNKNYLDHSVSSPKKNQSSNYYSQLLGRTNSHLHSGFMSPQINSINAIHQSQTAMTNSIQVSSILHQSQNQNSINSAFQNSANIVTAINSIQNIPINLESSQKNANQVSNSTSQNITNNTNNNFKLTDILSTRYSSGTLKLIRNGQASISSNPRQLSSDARQFDGGGSQHSNSNQDFNHSPANIHNNKQSTLNNGQLSQNTFNNTNIPSSNFSSIGSATSQKQQLMNKVKIQLSSQQQQKNQQFATQLHSQNVHNIHSGYGAHSSTNQNVQQNAISPRTFSNLVQDKLMRSKLQSSQQLQTNALGSSQSSVKDTNKNALSQSKRPKSLKQIENEYNSNSQNHQMIHEQNMNILAGMTHNNRNGSEKNLLRSQQMAGQIVSQNIPASQSQNQQQNQYQQHVQQIQASKVMLLQQQNNTHNSTTTNTDQLNNLINISSKANNSVTPSSQTQMSQKYETNMTKHQTSHSVEKFRGQSESLDTHNRQQDNIVHQVEKIVGNKQQLKKVSTTIPETSKNRNKKNNEHNYRGSFSKKQQQNQTLQTNLSSSQQGIALHQNYQNANSHQLNNASNTNNNYMISNFINQANQGLSNSYANSNLIANSSKQTLTAITQRIQQNLNTLTDPIHSNKAVSNSQNTKDQQVSNNQQNKQNNIQNTDDIINKVEINQQDMIRYEKREPSEKNSQINQANISPISSSKMHKQTNSFSESNKNSQQNTLQKEEIHNYQQNLQHSINLLINNSQIHSKSGQQPHVEQINSNSNTPQGKLINQGHYKQQTQAQNKDGAKHQIYFMKEKDRVSKKNDYGQQKNKRKGEQSTPHSNSQGYPQILMSNSALNQSSQGRLALSALQKSSGSITNSVNHHLLNSNIIKYINKQSNKNEENQLFEQQGLNQMQISQYLANIQKDNSSKKRDSHVVQQNQNQEAEIHHEKKNSFPEENQSFKKAFASAEGSYLWDLKYQNDEIIPYISPKNITNYNSLTGQIKNQEKNMSSIQEVNSHQSIQNKNSSQNISNSKQQSNKHVVLSQNAFASPIFPNIQNQNQQIGSSINQSKSINEDYQNNNATNQDKGKYYQTLFNIVVKDNKKHILEKAMAQEIVLTGNSNSHQKSNMQQLNSLSQVNEPVQKQPTKDYPQSDQKLEEIPSNTISYNAKSQFKMQTSGIPQIKLYAASAETSPPLAGQNYNVEQITQPITQINSQFVCINPFNQLRSQVLRQGEQVIEKLKEVAQKDIKQNNSSHHNGAELSSLNSSLVQIKSRQSVYSQSECQLQHSKSKNNLLANHIESENNISFSQNKFQYNPNLEFKSIQKKTEAVLDRYKQHSIQQAQSIKECNIRISELNSILKEKDNQLQALQNLLKESENLIESQKQEVNEKNDFINLLNTQIQDILQNSQMYQTTPKNSDQTLQTFQNKNNINVVNNYVSSPSAANHSNHSINSSSPKRLIKNNNYLQYPSLIPFNGASYAQEGSANLQSNQQQVRLSLPVFPQKHFGLSTETPTSNQENCLFQSHKDLEESADFTGNKDNSLESLKRKYQINSLNKKSLNYNSFQIEMYGSKSLQSSQNMYSNKDQLKGNNNQNSNNGEQENDPLNDSTKLLKQISKKCQNQHDQNLSNKDNDFSDNSWPRQIKQQSLDFTKHNYDQNINVINNESNKFIENHYNFGIQGSFSNLQTVENQEENIKNEFQNQQIHKQSEAFTQATPTNSQNQALTNQKESQPNQRYQNRLFSTDQEDCQSNKCSNNPFNPNDSFNTGFAHFGGSNEAETNSQNIDNSFKEFPFGQSSNNEQTFSQSELHNNNVTNAQNLIEQNNRLKFQNEEIISVSSKSSYYFKTASDCNSPNMNDGFNKKQQSTQLKENNQIKDSSNFNQFNNSFNNNYKNEDDQEDQAAAAATIQFANSSFSQIPENDQAQSNQQSNQNNNMQSFSCENQINISFEGGLGCQNDEKRVIEQELIQNQNQEQQNEENELQQEEDQQQGISFANQSFG